MQQEPRGRRAVWVTGATGFLGGAACDALEAAGYEVTRVVRADAGREAEKPSAIACDLVAGSPMLPGSATPPSTVVHLAAEIPVTFEGDEIERVALRNRAMDDNVFAFVASVGAALVFASSGSVYGEGRGQVFTEAGRVDPRGPYADAKLQSERLGPTVLRPAGAPFAALRISAPYGPGQGTRTVVRHFLHRAITGEKLEYHGTGSRMQDFIYVTDVADAIVRCVETSAAGVFNIASGAPISMRELAELVADVVGGDIGVGPSGQADPQEGLSADYSIDAARSAFGWRPATTLPEGLRRWRDQLVEDGR